mgnify:CR=1 FL=1
MDLNTMKHLRTTRDSYTSSQNWIQARSISVKRTSGGRRYYQKIQNDLGECVLESRATGEDIMALVKNFKYSLNSEGEIITKEKSLDSAEPKEKCLTMRQKLSSIMTSFFPMSGSITS